MARTFEAHAIDYDSGEKLTSKISITIRSDWPDVRRTGVEPSMAYYTDQGSTLYGSIVASPGYKFLFRGWSVDLGNSRVLETEDSEFGISSSDVATSAGITARAVVSQLSPIGYGVKFNGNNATSGSMATQQFSYGTAQNLRTNAFARTGYVFQGWDTSAAGNTVVYTNGQSVSNLATTDGATVNLYAVWALRTTAITLNRNGGSGGSASVTATYNSAMPTITPPTTAPSGYAFNGYWTATSGGTQYYKADGTSHRNWNIDAATYTLYAQWVLLARTVTYSASGATNVPSPQTVAYGTNITLSSQIPIKSGYTFSKWRSSSDGAYYNPGATYTSNANTTMTAIFAANQYTLTFDPMNGTVTPASKTVTYNAAIGALPTPVMVGGEFLGWYADTEFTIPITAETIWQTVGNGTIYASYLDHTSPVYVWKNGWRV